MTMNRRRRWIQSLLLAVLGALATGGAGGVEQPKSEPTPEAHEGHTMPVPASGTREKGEATTITGEVMDPACFLEAGPKSIGPGHFQCAVDCARSGQTLAIYDRDQDRIYFIAGELPGKNPNDPVINFIHKKVDVSGVVYYRSGVFGIVINKVVLHVEPPAAKSTPP